MEEFSLLVVDDDSRYLRLLKAVADHAGINICCAENGEEALAKITGRYFNLVFTDLDMPGMNGLELARRVRVVSPETCIVMITVNPSPEISTLALKAGVSKVYLKPYTVKGVTDIIDENR